MQSHVKASLFLVLCAATAASAQTPISLTVSGNEARGTVELPGGIGATLTIAFEEVVGLNPLALDVWASLVVSTDLALLSRLPALVSVPGAFPVLLSIEPSASSALSFAGVAKVELYTHNLLLDPSVPLALNKASAGGTFRDVTTSEGRGSYRVSGSTGDFSEWLIVIDTRPIDAIIMEKFDALQAALTEHAASMPATVAEALQARLSQARLFYESGARLAAIGELVAFSAQVKAHSGGDIPDVWRAHDTTRVNVAGLLRSSAGTLRFSLDRKTQ